MISAFVPKISLVGITVVHHPSSDSGKVTITGQIIAAAWLLYMDACALYAISDVKVWGNRALVKRQTYAESACWYSLQVAKLTVPLSYNFITMLSPTVYKATSFHQFLGQYVNLTGLGEGFNTFFPCFLLIPVLATFFNFYGKIKNLFGFGFLDDESEENQSGFGTGGWREGRDLIKRELEVMGADGRDALALHGREEFHDSEGSNLGASSSARRDRANDSRPHESNRRFNAITNEPEYDSDEGARHFYDDLSERMRNTLDSVERPEWMRNWGEGIEAPRWMQGGEVAGSALARWFGGRPEDGRVRL